MKKIIFFGMAIGIVGIFVWYRLVMEYEKSFLTILGIDTLTLMGFITAFIAVIFSYIIGKRITKGDKTRLAVLPYIIFGLIAAAIPYFVGIILIMVTCVFGC